MAVKRSTPTLIRERIRECRESAGLSRSALALRVGVQPSAAAQWEQPDGTAPNVENLAKIAIVCGVAFEWLATGRGSPRGTEAPAIAIEAFAQDLFEERLLELGRKLRKKRRSLVLSLIEELV
jgi:transcriptional regulator with XRE-family HTH domain